MDGCYIGMDVGGTHLRLKITDASHIVLGEYFSPGCSLNISGYALVKEAYAKTINRALKEHGYTAADCLGLCAGAAGVDSEKLRGTYHLLFEELGFASANIHVYNDCEIFLHRFSGAGIVAVAGTGSITLGKNQSGRMIRRGGWGHLLSDEGSGFFIARRAMEEIIRCMDGAASCPQLKEIFIRETGLVTQHDYAMYIFRHIAQKREIAKYAPLVDEAMRAGDSSARKILDEAAAALWDNIRTVAGQICQSGAEPLTVQLWGSLFVHNMYIYSQVENMVRNAYPQAAVCIPPKDALDTALEIAFTAHRP